MKKIVKPAYTVDFDEIHYLDDIDFEFAMSKQQAHLALTDDELLAIVDRAAPKCSVYYVKCDCDCTEKKLPWYKRLWNWLKKPFTKK